MDHHYGELQFLHTFSQNISIGHKFTPSISSGVSLKIILCDSERKYNTSESGAIYLSLLQNNDELINFKKPKKFNALNNFNRKQINHYNLTKDRGPLQLENSYLLFPLTSALRKPNCTNYVKDNIQSNRLINSESLTIESK